MQLPVFSGIGVLGVFGGLIQKLSFCFLFFYAEEAV